MERTETVYNGKAKIQEKENIEWDQCQLIFAGRALENGRSLAE